MSGRKKVYPRKGETPRSPSHLRRRIASLSEVGSVGQCWPWLGATTADGYGRMTVGGATQFAHRVAFEVFVRPLRAGEQVRHTCDNPSCVNHHHLQAGSRSDNMRDMVDRGRHGGPPPTMPGGRNPASKITRENADEIRHRLADGETQAEVARAFGISQSMVSKIKRGEAWR